MNRFDALVIGAGPAGASAATLLARAGWSVAVVEKQTFPRRKVCGECVAASNLPLLAALGITPEQLDAVAAPALRYLTLMQSGEHVTAPLPPAADANHAWGRAVGRETLDTLLLEQARAAGALVFQPWSVLSVDGRPGDVRAAVQDMSTGARVELHAQVAILANGSWEPLASARQVTRRPRRGSDLLAFKANFVHADLDIGLLPVLAFAGGYGGMVVADGGMLTLACCLRADRLATLRAGMPGRSAGEVVEAMLRRECDGVDDALRRGRRNGPWLGSGPIDPGIRLREGELVFRIGNAAGEAHPIIGEGMSMAMQSAWLLCDRLLAVARVPAAGDAAQWHAEVARRYAADWRRHFAMRLRFAAVLAHIAMRPFPAKLLLAVTRRVPSALTFGACWCAKVRCAVGPETISRLAADRSGPPLPQP